MIKKRRVGSARTGSRAVSSQRPSAGGKISLEERNNLKEKTTEGRDPNYLNLPQIGRLSRRPLKTQTKHEHRDRHHHSKGSRIKRPSNPEVVGL